MNYRFLTKRRQETILKKVSGYNYTRVFSYTPKLSCLTLNGINDLLKDFINNLLNDLRKDLLNDLRKDLLK